MKIKSGFVVQRVGNAYLAVAVGKRADEFNAMIRMNATGAFLWEQLSSGDRTEAELSLALVREYGISSEVADRDTAAIVGSLRQAGLLDE